LNIALYETLSGVGMLIVSAHGKRRWAHFFCESRMATKSALSLDSAAMTVSHAFSCASRTDCGVDDELDAAREQLRVVVGVLEHLQPLAVR
jgi:hypothetical protein